MMSMTGFSSIPGGLAVRSAIERFGVARSIQLGLVLSMFANLGNLGAAKGWHFMLLLFPMRCGPTRAACSFSSIAILEQSGGVG